VIVVEADCGGSERDRWNRHWDGEHPHVLLKKRSNTAVELKPEAAAISLIDRSGRLESNVRAARSR
jgi:hypothetical protein